MQFQLQTIRNPHISCSGCYRISYVCVDNLSWVYFPLLTEVHHVSMSLCLRCHPDHYSCEWDIISTRTETRPVHFIRSFNYRCDTEYAWFLQEVMFVKADFLNLFSTEVKLIQTHMFFWAWLWPVFVNKF